MPAKQEMERLITEYGDALFRMCYLYLKDYHLAEDAAQETFIKAMKHYDRELIILYYYQELSMKEIAQMIGKSENVTIQRVNRARKKLKKILMEVGYGA